jgi:divalent anion:Na+ symporter, DASS family
VGACADQLSSLGIARWIGGVVSSGLAGLPPLGACVVLAIIYFYSMYLFCSLTGHIIAFVGPFLEAGKALGAPSYVLLALLSSFSTLCGCLTNYSTGPLIIYFSQVHACVHACAAPQAPPHAAAMP